MKRSFALVAAVASITLLLGCQPGGTANGAATATPVLTPVGAPGSISGMLQYPADQAPALRVFAVDTTNCPRFFYTTTQPNQLTFSISIVPPGTYYLLAYVAPGAANANAKALAGGYTRAATCDPNVTCTDHTLIPVTVTSGQAVIGIRVYDWYAPPGAFPTPPTV